MEAAGQARVWAWGSSLAKASGTSVAEQTPGPLFFYPRRAHSRISAWSRHRH